MSGARSREQKANLRALERLRREGKIDSVEYNRAVEALRDTTESPEYGGIEESKANLQAQLDAGEISQEDYESAMAELEEVGANENSGIKYSLSEATVPTRKELESKKPIKVVNVKEGLESGSYADMKAAAKNKATNEGWFDVPHHNVDTDSFIFLTEKSFTHAYSNLRSDFGEDTIRCMAHIPEIIQEAVLVSIDNPKDNRKAETKVYTFLGAIDGINGVEPVKLTVKEFDFRSFDAVPKNIKSYFVKNGISEKYNSLYDTHALEVIGIEGIQKESDASGKVGEQSSRAQATSDSTISIADLLNLVKGEAEKYIPKYSFEDLDNKYLNAVNSGDMETARRLVEEAARKAGYTDKVYHGTQKFGFTEFVANYSDDKISFFAAGSSDLAQTYSGRYGDKNISDIKSANDLSIEDVVKRLSEEAKENYLDRQLESEYRIMTLQDINDLVNEVKSGIDELQEIVKHKIKVYADKMALDFNDTDAKTHSQLVELYGILQNNRYERMSTPIYVLLHKTNAFDGNSEIADLESKIRLMNKLSRVNTNDGVIVAKQLGGYSYDIFSFDEARKELQDRLSYGNYALFGKPGNQLVIDGRGQIWNDIRYWSKALEKNKDDTYVKKEDGYYTLYDKDTDKEIAGGKFAVNSYTERLGLSQLHYVLVDNVNNMLSIQTESINSTRDIVRYAKKLGYDSVKFENIRDNGGRGEDVGAGDVYAYFNPNDLKSADTVTYDEDGNVIPLSERFNSEKTDIRFSLEDPTREDVISELRQYMNGARSKEQMRDIFARVKKNPQSEIYGGPAKRPQYSEGVQKILADAERDGMTVRDYISQNIDEFEVRGKLTEDARKALEISGDYRNFSVEEVRASRPPRSIEELDRILAEVEPLEPSDFHKTDFDRWYERREKEDRLREKMAELVMKSPDENEINTTLDELASDLENGYITPDAALEVVEGLKTETDGARVKYSVSNTIENLDSSWYNEIELSAAERERVQSEALTWNADKRNQLIIQTLSNGITYRYVIDEDGIVHIYGKEQSVNIHERKNEYDNANGKRLDSTIEELRLRQGNNSGTVDIGENGRKPSKDDTNDNSAVRRKGRGNRTGHSKNRSDAYGQPKEIGWHFNDDGSYDVTYSDGTVEKKFSLEAVDVPTADTIESLRSELETAIAPDAALEVVEGLKTETGGARVKYSVEETTDGRPVVVIDNDVLAGIDTTVWDKETLKSAQSAAKEALNRFSNGIPLNNILYKVNSTTKSEFTHSNYSKKLYRKNKSQFADKMRMSNNVDEILSSTSDWWNDGELNHERNDSFVDFVHGYVLIQCGKNQYIAETIVGITSIGEYVLYDIVDINPDNFQIKKGTSQGVASGNNAFANIQGDSFDDIVPQESENVKHEKQFSLEGVEVQPIEENSDTKADGPARSPCRQAGTSRVQIVTSSKKITDTPLGCPLFLAEKERFELSRRLNPTYTLSRGASSAS